MIGVVVPAHNEDAYIAHCLCLLLLAGRCPPFGGEKVLPLDEASHTWAGDT